MNVSFNVRNEIYFNKSKANKPSFGIKIPELESAIDTFVSKPVNNSVEKRTLVELIKKFAKTIFQPESFIGSGCESKVYDMGKYVFKIPKNVFFIPKSGNEVPLYLTPNIVKNKHPMNLDSYYGESLLEIGNLRILRNIGEHIPCGVPYSILKNMSKEEIYNYYFEKYFPKIAKLPQSAFDKFAQDINKIKYPKTIDFQNPNNTTITIDDRIILTDDLLNCNKYCGENSTAKLLRIFMLDASLDIYTPGFDKYLKEVQGLFKKIVLAGEKAGLIISSCQEDNLLLKDALSKCNAKIGCDEFLQCMSKIRRSNESAADKLKNIEGYINGIFE